MSVDPEFVDFVDSLAAYPAKQLAAAGGSLAHQLKDSSYEPAQLLAELLDGLTNRHSDGLYSSAGCTGAKQLNAIKEKPIEFRREVVLVATAIYAAHLNFFTSQFSSGPFPTLGQTHLVSGCCSELLQKNLHWDEPSLTLLSELLDGVKINHYNYPLNRVVTLIGKNSEEDGSMSHLMRKSLARIRDLCQRTFQNEPYADQRKLIRRCNDMLADSDVFQVLARDAWTSKLAEELAAASGAECDGFKALLNHCATVKGSKPGKKFIKEGLALWTQAGDALCENLAASLFDAAGTRYEGDVDPYYRELEHERSLFHPDYSDVLKGLVWIAGQAESDDLQGHISDLAERCYTKIKDIGPRNVKVGNACVWVLGNHGGLEGVAQINRLLTRVKHASLKSRIELALDAASLKHGISREDLDDMASPTCGLTGIGVRRESFGDFEAELCIVSGSSTQTVWHTPQGKTQKTVPKVVRENEPAQLKRWKADDKKIKQTLQAQRDRLENTFLFPRLWSYQNWNDRLLEHPLMGWLARRLIWSFRAGDVAFAAGWLDGQLVDANDTPMREKIESLSDEMEVGLWHPIDATTDEVVGWREWLIRHEITQPIKQAHREVYLLTDAERETNTYSNRFAAHIIRQHQFNALCQARGWTYQLMGDWDSANTPAKVLPGCDLRAEFWVDNPGDTQTSESGVWLLLATDQVRFYECDPKEPVYSYMLNSSDPLTLQNVPPRVFTEVMRDVDLFVGVSSVGADPQWQERGHELATDEYWHEYSFGDLGHTAKTRREVLGRLIPRLKIAERCSFSDKFLVVKGDVRTYKIHLGSGNILMEPNDQYLCIVPGRGDVKGEAGKVFLPFEGDRTLSIILSKAFMLADDTKITDQTILSQIGR